MKKTMIGIAVLIVVAGVGILIWSKTRRVELESGFQAELISQEGVDNGDKISLLSKAENLEDAGRIADLYGITLVDFSGGVAVYETDKDVAELKKLGEENNYPALEINYTMKLD